MSRTARPALLPLRRPRGSETLFAWLYDELRTSILEGRLKPGELLPPTRTLARQWSISRGTVVRVFEQMISEAYLESRTGSGTSVNRKLPDEFFQASRKASSKKIAPAVLAPVSRRGKALEKSPFLGPSEQRALRAFTANKPSVNDFPADLWSRLGARRMRLASREMLQGGDVLGYLPLRQAIVAHLGATRGVRCDADQIMIVSGTQQSLDLVSRVTLDPGDAVWMEDPGYPGASRLFQAAGAKIVPVAVDENGLRVSEGIRRAPDARLAYVTPANQFPLCVTLPLERRMQLLEWSRSHGAWIFEDDYDTEFRFQGRPLPSLQGLAPDGNVIFAGSFSKMLFPSLRLGYLIMPPHLVDSLMSARSLTDRYSAVVEQAILCDFITEGHFDRHLRRMRQVYAENLEVLLSESARHWCERLVVQSAQAGLQTVAWLGEGQMDDASFCHAARGCGVDLMPLSAWALRWKRTNGVQVGFAAIRPEELRRGVRALTTLLR